MNTVKVSIKKTLLSIIVLVAIGSGAFAQDSIKMSRHFGGFYGGVDLTQTSTFAGISYEYITYRGKGKEFGVNFHYTFGYRSGNLIAFYEDGSQPRISSYGVGFTGYLFTNAQRDNKGFFVSGDLGITGTSWLTIPFVGSFLRPKGGLGCGWKWVTPKGKNLRLSNGLSYTGANAWNSAGLTAAATFAIGF